MTSESSVRNLPLLRLLWLDALRGLAVLGMIEAHSVNSFLAPLFRSGPWFTALSYLNGWVAPTFLFIAGLLQGVSLQKNWHNPRPLGHRIRSLVLILLIGYGLQFPWDALSYFNHGGAEKIYLSLGKIDVLHCLAISLISLLLLSRFFKKHLDYGLTVLFLTCVIFLTAPFIWKNLDHTSSHNPLLGYLTPFHGALFPLIPWFGFIAAGTLTTRWISRPSAFFFLTIAASVAGWAAHWILLPFLENQTYATRLDSLLFRLSLVFLTCVICSAIFQKTQTPGLLSKPILWCGRHSLGLYVWHLVILHSGLGIIAPLRSLYPKIQLPHTVFWLFLLTLISTILVTTLWNHLWLYLKKTMTR